MLRPKYSGTIVRKNGGVFLEIRDGEQVVALLPVRERTETVMYEVDYDEADSLLYADGLAVDAVVVDAETGELQEVVEILPIQEVMELDLTAEESPAQD